MYGYVRKKIHLFFVFLLLFYFFSIFSDDGSSDTGSEWMWKKKFLFNLNVYSFSFFPSNLFSLLSAVVILKFWLFQEEWKKYEEFMSLIIMNIIYPFSCRFLRLYNHIRLWPYVCSFGRRLTTHRHTHSNTESDERCDTRILYKCARETFHTRITRRRHQIRAYIIYMILCSI